MVHNLSIAKDALPLHACICISSGLGHMSYKDEVEGAIHGRPPRTRDAAPGYVLLSRNGSTFLMSRVAHVTITKPAPAVVVNSTSP